MLDVVENNDLFICFFYGAIAYVVHDYIFTPYFFTPIACASCAIDLKKCEGNQKKLVTEVFPQWLGKGIYSAIFIYLWYNWAFEHPECFDWRNWHTYINPMNDDNPELVTVMPLYRIYFSYVWWVFFKDISKPRKNHTKGKPFILQYLFDFHHILAIGLTYWSVRNGCWRGGVLTRMIHDPTDFALYSIKSVEAIYKSRTGKETDWVMFFLMVFVSVFWFFTRVFLYGIACIQFQRNRGVDPSTWERKPTDDFYVVRGGLIIGSWCMFALQVIWFFGTLVMIQKYFKGSETADFLHGDEKDKFKAKKENKKD